MTETAESLDPLRLPLTGERLIEASAGTGKTFTIAALYLRLLLGLGGICFPPAGQRGRAAGGYLYRSGDGRAAWAHPQQYS